MFPQNLLLARPVQKNATAKSKLTTAKPRQWRDCYLTHAISLCARQAKADDVRQSNCVAGCALLGVGEVSANEGRQLPRGGARSTGGRVGRHVFDAILGHRAA